MIFKYVLAARWLITALMNPIITQIHRPFQLVFEASILFFRVRVTGSILNHNLHELNIILTHRPTQPAFGYPIIFIKVGSKSALLNTIVMLVLFVQLRLCVPFNSSTQIWCSQCVFSYFTYSGQICAPTRLPSNQFAWSPSGDWQQHGNTSNLFWTRNLRCLRPI